MSNLKILNKNIFDDYATLIMSFGGTASGFPLTNLTNDKKSKTWRSTNLTTPKITVTWSTAQTLSGVALAFTNLIAGSTFRVYLYNATSSGTLLYDSGAVSVSEGYSIPAGFASIGSASYAYGGGAHASVFFNSVSAVRRMDIEFSSAGNPDGYIEISRIIAGVSVDPGRDAAQGAIVSFIDNTTSERTSSGDLITDRGTISRAIDFSLLHLNADSRKILNDLFRYSGRSQPIFVSLSTAATISEGQLFSQIYGKIDQDLALEIPMLNKYNASMRIIEI